MNRTDPEGQCDGGGAKARGEVQSPRGLLLPFQHRERTPDGKHRDGKSRYGGVLDRLGYQPRVALARESGGVARGLRQAAGAPEKRAHGEADIDQRRCRAVWPRGA